MPINVLGFFEKISNSGVFQRRNFGLVKNFGIITKKKEFSFMYKFGIPDATSPPLRRRDSKSFSVSHACAMREPSAWRDKLEA